MDAASIGDCLSGKRKEGNLTADNGVDDVLCGEKRHFSTTFHFHPIGERKNAILHPKQNRDSNRHIGPNSFLPDALLKATSSSECVSFLLWESISGRSNPASMH